MKKTIIITLISVGIILALNFIIPYFAAGIFNLGNILGLGFSAALIIYGAGFDIINSLIVHSWSKLWGRITLSITGVIALSAIIFVVAATMGIIKASHNEPEGDTTVVILGCQVKPWGPSLMLTERLEAAFEFLSENKDVKCVLSGGQGNDEPMSEAQAMYIWLTDKGIDESRLYIEDKSTNTRENLLFSKELIEKEGLPNEITLITHNFHQYRASNIAKSLGIVNYNISGKTHPVLFLTYYVRELAGILYEFIR